MNTKKIMFVIAGITMVAGMLFATQTFAQTVPNQPNQNNSQWQSRGGRAPGQQVPMIMGTVSSVNGTTITVNGHQGFNRSASTTATTLYTVDASNATVKKNNATSSVSAIVVGDTVSVQGTISGTNVTAKTIFDGVMGNKGNMLQKGQRPNASSTPQITGNGQPVVMGTVSAINGNTLTVTTGNNVVYIVDATNAKILEGRNAITSSTIVVGDNVVIQGSVNGTAVTASTIIDKPIQPQNASSTPKGPVSHGFFGGIFQFVKNLFGF